SASLLLFDDLLFKLTNGEQCHTLIQKHGPNYDDYFPPELNVLVGKRVLWRFQYTYDHIQNNNYLYQIMLLSVDEAMVTCFKQDFILELKEVEQIELVKATQEGLKMMKEILEVANEQSSTLMILMKRQQYQKKLKQGEELVDESTDEVPHSDEVDDRSNEYDLTDSFIDDGPLVDEHSQDDFDIDN
nr:replication protein A 70 kDa DNA-binding subunit B [Tanacetum cinerariifolium]